LHLGHARTFLIAYFLARAAGGQLLLRIEDLDAQRVRPGAIDDTLRDLDWLGLDWDGEPLIQSAGLHRINGAAAALAKSGAAYACVCSRADVAAAQSAPQQGDVEARYPGTCRGRFGSIEEAHSSSGKAAGLRLVVRPGAVVLDDLVHGRVCYDVASEVGDFLITRRDGAPAYQLAVVVDDAHQGVTHVVRGDDLLPSAARQWLVQEALGCAHPRYAHVPLVLDDQGRRLAKRCGDITLASLREGAVDPRAVVGWVAASSGMAVAERLTAQEAARAFDLDALPREPVMLTANTLAALRDAKR
jgi:glutamyl-tRNA synthetase